jgi:hypothetical protein
MLTGPGGAGDPACRYVLDAVVEFVALGAGFDGYCLADIARASQVGYLPKWAWALICLAQTPGGSISHLCVGRVSRARSARPGPAQRP